MNMTEIQSSQCLCGAVSITATDINPKFTVCHCDTCRTWGGAPFFAVQCGKNVTLTGGDNIKRFASSPWATRGFCGNCGTHLFYQLNKSGEYNMPVGLFPTLSGLAMEMQYFSDQRPGYYCFSNQTKEMSKAQIIIFFRGGVLTRRRFYLHFPCLKESP